MSNNELSLGEQIAFTATHNLIKELKTDANLAPMDIGKGVMVAALPCLRKELSNEEMARLYYEVADDYASRRF